MYRADVSHPCFAGDVASSLSILQTHSAPSRTFRKVLVPFFCTICGRTVSIVSWMINFDLQTKAFKANSFKVDSRLASKTQSSIRGNNTKFINIAITVSAQHLPLTSQAYLNDFPTNRIQKITNFLMSTVYESQMRTENMKNSRERSPHNHNSWLYSHSPSIELCS